MKRVIAFFSALLFAVSALAGPFAIVSSASPFQGSYTIATLPTCSASTAGATARASDVGIAPGMALVCDGARWAPDGMQELSRGPIPVGLAPSGTMANNGAVTLGTALPFAFSSCYMHFPANAIVAGSAAGLYYVVMSSTTVGQVFNNTYTTGIPTAPGSPTPFVTTGPGAYTASTARVTLIQVTVPGGLMGLNGSLDAESVWSATNNANVKTPVVSFGGTDLFPAALTSVGINHDNRLVVNTASAALQSSVGGGTSGGWGTASSGPAHSSVNTAADVTLKFDATKATATDWLGVEAYRIRISP